MATAAAWTIEVSCLISAGERREREGEAFYLNSTQRPSKPARRAGVTIGTMQHPGLAEPQVIPCSLDS